MATYAPLRYQSAEQTAFQRNALPGTTMAMQTPDLTQQQTGLPQPSQPVPMAESPASAAPPPAPATLSAPAVGLDSHALGSLSGTLGGLQTQQAGQQQFNTGLRDALMQQLTVLNQPVNPDDPALSAQSNAIRLENQRAAERSRSALAERAAGQGLSSSGALDTGILGIEQQRGEANAQGIGQLLGQEMQGRRNALISLLNPALALGDQTATSNINQQLAAINQQLAQSNFYDDSGYRLAALEALLNGQSIDAVLGGL